MYLKYRKSGMCNHELYKITDECLTRVGDIAEYWGDELLVIRWESFAADETNEWKEPADILTNEEAFIYLI